MPLRFLCFLFLFGGCLVSTFSSCQKEEPPTETPLPENDRIAETSRFSLMRTARPFTGPFPCGSIENLMVHYINPDQIKIRGNILNYNKWYWHVDAHRYILKNEGEVVTHELYYHPCEERIEYFEQQTWHNTSEYWVGRRIDHGVCPTEVIDSLPSPDCKTGPDNQICFDKDIPFSTFKGGTYLISGTTEPPRHTSISLYATNMALDSLTGRPTDWEGDYLHLTFHHPASHVLLSGTYPLTAAGTAFYQKDYSNNPEYPVQHTYEVQEGLLTITKEEEDYILQFELSICDNWHTTGYYKGPLYD